MAAEYIMQEMRDLHNEGQTLLYPRIVLKGQIGTEEMLESMTHGTTFNAAEAGGVLKLAATYLAKMMANGYSVRIEGIGIFAPTIGLKKGKEREQADGSGTRRNASSLRFTGASFRPDTELIQQMQLTGQLRRSERDGSLRKPKYDADERLVKLKEYLAQKKRISIGEYAYMMGMSHSTAGRELRRWAGDAASGIESWGAGAWLRYTLREL